MDKKATIYIAGHKGLVGSALYRNLESHGYLNIVVRTHAELNLEEPEAVNSFFETEKPQFVFLAAAKVGGIRANATYPKDFLLTNLKIQNNVIEASYKYGVRRLLFLGSSCIYPKLAPQPLKEKYLLTGLLEPSNEPYAIAKIAGVKLCEAFNRQHGTCFLSVMPTNLYGPNDNYDLKNSHVLPALIRKFHLAKLASKGDWEMILREQALYGVIPEEQLADLIAITTASGFKPPADIRCNSQSLQKAVPGVRLWGTGTPYREFLHADDLAQACIFLMNLEDAEFDELVVPPRLPLVNIGCGNDQTLKATAEIVANIVDYKGEIIWDQTRPDGTPRKILDVSIINALGWQAKISLKTGLRRTYNQYCAKINQNTSK
ncbi:GDP-L-fucose synthase [Desulfococcaceae bacterium HSG9]|nr:GDP-L-fucose synthase [Desulfococcaceae bacterium HSG9]